MNNPDRPDWIIKQTPDDVARYARNTIMAVAKQAILDRGVFKIVLAGGTTPKKIYALLTKQPCDWQHWQIYLGDERCLPANDPERNSEMIRQVLLTDINIPKENIHMIPAELGAQQAAIAYATEIEAALPFDMVLLGMGEDGHTASLFPGHLHDPHEWVHAVYNSPKPPPQRVTLSAKALSQCKYLLIIITGSSKKGRVIKWRNGDDLPIAQITSMENSIILLDSSAGSIKDLL